MKRAPQASYYDFSAAPRVAGPKQKYRDEQEETMNMMSDPRIVRGNTYAPVTSKSKIEFRPPQQTRKPAEQKNTKPPNRFGFDMGFQVSTPRALEGREHFSAQTEAFVETLRDKPIEYQRQCQTEFYLDRPTQRLFKFVQNGIDASTQIQEGDPDLFDFNFQVQPILEALLGKIVHNSRMELFQEQQLHEALSKKREYELSRNAALAQVQKLENNQNRLTEQKARRQLQYGRYLQQSEFAQKKLIGRVLSKQMLRHLKNNSQAMLQQQGFFQQPLELDLWDNFLPWLYQQIGDQLQTQTRIHGDTLNVLNNYGQHQVETSQAAIQKEAYRKKQLLTMREKERTDKEERKRQRAERKAREQTETDARKQLQQNQEQPSQQTQTIQT